MADPVPVDQCDVVQKEILTAYREKEATWHQWLRTDEYHPIWPHIYTMVVSDITFRTIAFAADHDKESALHNNLVRQAFTQGYLATHGLTIRRLTDQRSDVISLPRLLRDVRGNLRLITREVYVSGTGFPYESDLRPHVRFDQLSGTRSDRRQRQDQIPRRVIDIIESWLNIDEIDQVVDWSHKFLAHAADVQRNPVDLNAINPTMEKIAAAQKAIVRTAEAVSAYILHMPSHMDVVPAYQFSKFWRFEQFVSSETVTEAAKFWNSLEEDRNKWTQGAYEALVSISAT
jgi:HEPN superfamily AbiU2-like protein